MVFDYLIRRRITMHLNFFYVEQTPVPSDIRSLRAKEIIRLSARLSACDERLSDLAASLGVDHGPLSIRDRVERLAKLDALVATHYGIGREDYHYIIKTFEAFQEWKDFENDSTVVWNDSLIRKLNGEVRKRVLTYYDEISSEDGKEERYEKRNY
jgi:hypothetical protein